MADVPPIQPHEVLLRRIPSKEDWVDPVHPAAFGPLKSDTQGLSFIRAAIRSLVEESTNGRPGEFYLAAIQVRHLPDGLKVEPDTAPSIPWYPQGDSAHAIIPMLNYPARKDPATKPRVEQWMKWLADSPNLTVQGPFVIPRYDPPARWQPRS